MRLITLMFIFLLALPLSATAQDAPAFETVARQAADGTSLAADFYPADSPDAPLIIALHMLNSRRAAYEPIIPDLRAAGYALLNIDMRGHGASGGPRDWELAIDDVAGWIAWLADRDGLGEGGLVLMGASIGANVALVACAASPVCQGAIALSPGLDYRGVRPETALVEGLAERAALLAAAHDDRYSADTVRILFASAQGSTTARLYRGNSHGTRLFDSDYESISRLILAWLNEHSPVPGEGENDE